MCLVCYSSLTKRKSGWGICGSSGWFVWFLVCCDLPAFPDLLGHCTNDVFTAYAHVRTEPQCDIGHTREKKIMCSRWELGSFASGGITSKPPGYQFILWDTNAKLMVLLRQIWRRSYHIPVRRYRRPPLGRYLVQ